MLHEQQDTTERRWHSNLGRYGYEYLQLLQAGLNIRKFEEDCCVRDTFVVEHEADSPDDRREAHILGASQIIENNFWFEIVGHLALVSDVSSVESLGLLPVSDQNQCSSLGCSVYANSRE